MADPTIDPGQQSLDKLVYGHPAASAALSELRRDAGRYRWLREHSCQTDSDGNDAESWSTHSKPESLDAAIDAALKEIEHDRQ